MRVDTAADEAARKEVNEMRLKGKKPLPVGVDDFREVIEGGYYYFDKTRMIEGLLTERAKVTLFTRPRRFGKTLNMSMLKYFFDMEGREENRGLFEGLYISGSKYMESQGQHPVIYVSFKNIGEEDWGACLRQMKYCISRLYNGYRFLEKVLVGKDLKDFTAIWMGEEEADWTSSLSDLSRYLSEYYGRKAVILIDEYDAPIISAYMNGYYREAVGFFRKLYGDALKGNSYLEMGVMTGILRIAKEGIFSGLNNLNVYSIFDGKYSDYYGFTEDEVLSALEYYEVSHKINEVREWYDGYLFGGTEVYNPWSILKYLLDDRLGDYWIGTSNNGLIRKLLGIGDEELFGDLECLLRGDVIYKEITDNTEFTYSIPEIWELFTYSGYLTPAGGRLAGRMYPLRIPNREVRDHFGELFIREFMPAGYVKVYGAASLLKECRVEEFAARLQSDILSSLSYLDLERGERYYKVFLIGLFMVLSDDYFILSERETGHGRADIVLEPRDRRRPGYVFELKVAREEAGLERSAVEALHQAGSRGYDVELRSRGIGRIIRVGMAFHRKKVAVRYDVKEVHTMKE